MMGERQVKQEALFYEFSLERHVPADHLLRSIDRFVDSVGCGATGAVLQRDGPALDRSRADDPHAAGRLLLRHPLGAAAVRGGAPESRLSLVLPARARGAVPDHSTFSKNRHGRFRDSDLLRQVFETTVGRCMAEGLVGGEGFAVDASLIRADAQPSARRPGERGRLPQNVEPRGRRVSGCSRRCGLRRAPRRSIPKFISPADPAARWTAATAGRAFCLLPTNYLIDLKHAVIIDVEATTAVRQAEVTAAKRMIERAQDASISGPSG